MKEKEYIAFAYELKSSLNALSKLVSELPQVLPDEIKQNADAAFSDLNHHIEKATKALESYQVSLNRFQEKACELYDEAYKNIKKKKEETDRRIEELAKLKEIKCRVPYNFTELINMAERLSRLSDEQFKRIVDLAKAFAETI